MIAVGLLLTLAATGGPLRGSAGPGASLDVHVSAAVRTVVLGLLALSTLLLFSMLRRGRPTQAGPAVRPPARRLPAWAAALVSVLPLLLLALAWHLVGSRWGAGSGSTGEGAFAAIAGLLDLLARARKPATSVPLFDQAVAALLVLASVAIFAVMVLVATAERLERRRPGRPAVAEAPPPAEPAGDLRAEPDARAAIIRAYGRFERALATARAPRATWQTPAEFMRSTVARLPLPVRPVERLTGLFELARFSDRVLAVEARDAACDCLDEITAALAEEAARER